MLIFSMEDGVGSAAPRTFRILFLKPPGGWWHVVCLRKCTPPEDERLEPENTGPLEKENI